MRGSSPRMTSHNFDKMSYLPVTGRIPARSALNDGPREDAMKRLISGAALVAALLLLAPVSFAQNAAQAPAPAPAARPQALVASPLPAAAPEDVGMSKAK